MNKRQEKRLRNVVRALRDAQQSEELRDNFTMTFIFNDCHTPGCALGHYVARNDLQGSYCRKGRHLVDNSTGEMTDLLEIGKKHFGLRYADTFALFGASGCAGATTPAQAADYIERFIERSGSN